MAAAHWRKGQSAGKSDACASACATMASTIARSCARVAPVVVAEGAEVELLLLITDCHIRCSENDS